MNKSHLIVHVLQSLRNWAEEYDCMTVQLYIINKDDNLMEIVFWNTTEGSNEIRIILRIINYGISFVIVFRFLNFFSGLLQQNIILKALEKKKWLDYTFSPSSHKLLKHIFESGRTTGLHPSQLLCILNLHEYIILIMITIIYILMFF